MVKNLEFESRLTKKNAKIGYKATKKGLKPLFFWYQTYAFNMCANNNINTNEIKCHRCNNNIDTLVENKILFLKNRFVI